ncbi:hypothetical protein [Amycolatopsis samaneae]|uniref:Transcriptional regulator n=1 Tax=Amycolatopsis samaneae TaxID=664691 RepID=A0ABW5GUZ2_9PSEU
MKRETIELVKALKAVTVNVENIGNALLIGRMTPAEQREYAGLLAGLAELLETHAEDQEANSPPVVDAGRHALRSPTSER